MYTYIINEEYQVEIGRDTSWICIIRNNKIVGYFEPVVNFGFNSPNFVFIQQEYYEIGWCRMALLHHEIFIHSREFKIVFNTMTNVFSVEYWRYRLPIYVSKEQWNILSNSFCTRFEDCHK